VDRAAVERSPGERGDALILVVCAIAAELRGFAKPDGVEILACGVGPVEAAAETARILTLGRFAALINAGIGGAFRGRATIGEAVIVSEERFADFGLEDRAPLTLPDGVHLEERVTASRDLLERCADLPYRVGSGLTVTTVTTTDATAERLSRAYGADVESMEGFAVLRAASLAGLPALEVRGISNYVGDRARGEWNFRAGAGAVVAALDAIVPRLLAPR
jgi:futalosine hydrolase